MDTVLIASGDQNGVHVNIIFYKSVMKKQLQFKTNINCGNCVRSVTGFLNDVDAIEKWEVDTANPDKILTVEGEDLDPDAVIEAVEEAGFDIALHMPPSTRH
jgi:copper chaperone